MRQKTSVHAPRGRILGCWLRRCCWDQSWAVLEAIHGMLWLQLSFAPGSCEICALQRYHASYPILLVLSIEKTHSKSFKNDLFWFLICCQKPVFLLSLQPQSFLGQIDDFPHHQQSRHWRLTKPKPKIALKTLRKNTFDLLKVSGQWRIFRCHKSYEDLAI